MEKRRKKEHDFSVTAFRVVQEATEQIEPEPQEPAQKKVFDAKALGRLGGLKGGKARAEKLTSEQRSEIAKKAAKARWVSSKQ
ncbi:hypothetical protein ES707_17825 [subsurface metagenome]